MLLTLYGVDFMRRIDTIKKYSRISKGVRVVFRDFSLLFTEIGVGMNAQLAQHITLPLVNARALSRFCLVLIQVNNASHSAYSYLSEQHDLWSIS